MRLAQLTELLAEDDDPAIDIAGGGGRGSPNPSPKGGAEGGFSLW